MSAPLILVTNDDGIGATGLRVMAGQLEAIGEVIVAAPDREQSAVGHGISLARPLRVTDARDGWHAVSGTPADCVMLALLQLCPRRPSLVVSGMNVGVNLGADVFYSGTVAGALEGAIHEIPAIAVSQDLAVDVPIGELLARTARFASALAAQVLDKGLPPRSALNINAPSVLTEEFRWTRHGRRAYREQADRRLDLRGVPYYWIGGPPLACDHEPGTDGHTLAEGLISVTLLGLDLTAPPPSWYDQWRPGRSAR